MITDELRNIQIGMIMAAEIFGLGALDERLGEEVGKESAAPSSLSSDFSSSSWERRATSLGDMEDSRSFSAVIIDKKKTRRFKGKKERATGG